MPSLGGLYKLAKRRAILRRVVESTKQAALPQYDPVPFSSLTARADFIRNRKYKPEPNPLTSEEQDALTRLVAGMSRSRARVVDKSRQGHEEVRRLLSASKLWA